MTALNRKLLSNLGQMKIQLLAIALVMASGVAVFVMSLTTYSSLKVTQDNYYDEYRFANFFSHLKRAPDSVKAQIETIAHVGVVQTRVVADVVLDIPEFVEPVAGRIIGISEKSPESALNRLYLRKGRMIEPGSRTETIVHEAFAEAHGFKLGGKLSAILNGHKEQLNIVGIALSPEYVYGIRPGDLIPDDKRFGVMWMGEKELRNSFDLDGAFNDVALTTMPGAVEQEVIERLDDILAPYGSGGAYSRADQSSHRAVFGELTQLRSMALVFPIISLAVAGFLLNVVFSRLVATQQEEIATLKAFGYTSKEIRNHYLKFVFLVLLVGILIGTGAGIWLALDLFKIYVRYFRFPVFLFRLEPSTVLIALGLCAVAGISGTITAVERAAQLLPAEAMRPAAPSVFRPTIIERLGLHRFISPSWQLVLRYIERQPIRSAFTCLGIALPLAVLVLGTFIADSVNYVIDFQFNLLQRQDMTVGFVEPQSSTTIYDLVHLPAVIDVQPFRTVSARLRAGYRSRRIAIFGLSDERRLFRVMDVNERELDLPEEGLVLSSKAAEVLGLVLGDTVIVEVLEGDRAIRPAKITGIVEDFGEPTAYMNLRTLRRFLREGEQISGAFISIDEQQINRLHHQLKKTPKVANVGSKSAALIGFRKIFTEHLLRMRTFDVVFGCIMVFGVVYNSARISLAERSRDLATLRVMGFTRREIFNVILGELSVLTFLAIPVGMVLGYYLSAFAVYTLATETQRFPLVIGKATYGFAIVVVIVAAFVSALIVRRRLEQLDLVAVLKAKE
jgi:putative ABC transport system permease protein